MKNLLRLLALTLILGAGIDVAAQDQLTKVDRKKAITALKSSKSRLLKSVKGLSDRQLNFKASPESWSVAECLEHLATSEGALFGLTMKTLEGASDPSQKKMQKLSDEQVVQFIEDRSTKIKTQQPLEPKNNYGSYVGSVDKFKAERKISIKYVKKTADDLRNHFYDFPFGKVDSYQVLLFMSGHTVRHTKQIEEVMASTDFPKG